MLKFVYIMTVSFLVFTPQSYVFFYEWIAFEKISKRETRLDEEKNIGGKMKFLRSMLLLSCFTKLKATQTLVYAWKIYAVVVVCLWHVEKETSSSTQTREKKS
jgi:hypothetical protein